MRLQSLIIATLLSLIAWVGTFDATRSAYRDAQKANLIPNLRLQERLSLL